MQTKGMRIRTAGRVASMAAALLLGCGGGDPDRVETGTPNASSAMRRALAVRTPDATELFDWAEKTYSQFFPGHQFNQSFDTFTYRYYPATGNYVGLSGTTISVLGPISGGSILVVGQVSDFACLVYPADCAPLNIDRQPTDQRNTAPGPVSYQVVASGASALSYQWQVSGNGETFTDIAGATADTYALAATAWADTGKFYRVVVSNSAGSVTSRAAALTVYPALTEYGFSPLAARMKTPRAMHTATDLADGTILITGGFTSGPFPNMVLDTAELYDPATGTFTTLTARMRSPRASHAATRLVGGQVLLTGGQVDTTNGDGADTAEIYDPATRSFTSVASPMKSPRGGHTASFLFSGKVLVAGGFNQGPGTLTADAELFDPSLLSFSALAGRMVESRTSHQALWLLGARSLLLTGGSRAGKALDSAELFDPADNRFKAVAARMGTARAAHSMHVLVGGTLVLAGGAGAFGAAGTAAFDTAEAYDPITQTFTPLSARMSSPRAGHAAAYLPDGSALLTGGVTTGSTAGPVTVLDSVEVFRNTHPVDRPEVTITATPATLVLGGSTLLQWTAQRAVSCSASGNWEGPRGVAGSRTITPTATGLQGFYLLCTGLGGVATAGATVQVQTPAPTLRLTATPSPAPFGSTIVLGWTTTDATGCVASKDWSGPRSAQGNDYIPAGTVATTKHFALTCNGPGGSVSAETSVVVQAPPPPLPTVSLTATPTSAAAGSTISLSWSTSNATSCTASANWAGARSISGRESIYAPAIEGTAPFTLTCTGAGGSASATASVAVTLGECVQIGGSWSETARVTLNCIPAEASDTIDASGVGSILQNGCSIRYTVAGQLRTGTVVGRTFTLTGPVAVAQPGATLTANHLTINGTISSDTRKMIATGTGQLAGSAPDGSSANCAVSSSSTLTR